MLAIKIWVVIMVMGNVAESIGPVPYDMAECRDRIADMAKEYDADFEQHDPNDPDMIINGHQITRADITLDCVTSKPVFNGPSRILERQ